RRTGTTPVDLNTKATRDQNNFGAPSHGLGTRCLRFVPAVTHGRTQDSLPAVGQTLRNGIDPQGSYERFRECILHAVLLSQILLGETSPYSTSFSCTSREREADEKGATHVPPAVRRRAD